MGRVSFAELSCRHDDREANDATEVLELLEGTREQLGGAFTKLPDEVAVVIHPSPVALSLAQPYLPIVWLLTSPAGRRYLGGWCSSRELHMLSPRQMEQRASNVGGSKEMLMLSPAALYTQLVVATNNRALPPPFRISSFARYLRWAWLIAGAAQYFSGQTAFARPVIARRLREGKRPSFPPSVRDAPLLGGSVFDLLANERGRGAAIALACTPPDGSPQRTLEQAFGRAVVHTEGAWRTHLARLAEP